MINGANDGVVDPKTARAFVQAARPHYHLDPHRLQLIIYEDVGHNIPLDPGTYVEYWSHKYMHPWQPPPRPFAPPKDLVESVTKTQITATDHKEII